MIPAKNRRISSFAWPFLWRCIFGFTIRLVLNKQQYKFQSKIIYLNYGPLWPQAAIHHIRSMLSMTRGDPSPRCLTALWAIQTAFSNPIVFQLRISIASCPLLNETGSFLVHLQFLSYLGHLFLLQTTVSSSLRSIIALHVSVQVTSFCFSSG